MFAALGIVLLFLGAVVLFAVDRSAEGFDLVAIGWILMGGGGLSLLISTIQTAGPVSQQRMTMSDRAAVASGRPIVNEFVGADGRRSRRSS